MLSEIRIATILDRSTTLASPSGNLSIIYVASAANWMEYRYAPNFSCPNICRLDKMLENYLSTLLSQIIEKSLLTLVTGLEDFGLGQGQDWGWGGDYKN